MKSSKHVFIIGLFGLLFAFSTSLRAQDFYRHQELSDHTYEIYYKYSSYGLTTVGATESQITAVTEAGEKYREQYNALLSDFIYHEDLKAADDQNFAAFEAKVKSILTEQQLANIGKSEPKEEDENQGFDPANWDKAAYVDTATDFFLEEYEFMDISPEQAVKLAEAQADILANKDWDNYEELMNDAHSKVLSPAQMEKYEAYKVAEEAREVEVEADEAAMHVDSISEEEETAPTYDEEEVQQRMAEYQAQYAERTKEEIKFMELALDLLKSYYVPERANIRANIELQLSPSDRAALKEMRERYEQFLANMEPEADKGFVAPLGAQLDDEYYAAYAKVEQEIKQLDDKELLGVKGNGMNDALEAFLQSDRSVFYSAKTLASNYDKILDIAAKENDLLIISWIIQLLPNAPKREYMPDNFEEQIRQEFLKEVYQTKEVEYRRNITFLLAKPGEVYANLLQSNRSLHSLTVFPIPAKEQQTINFVLAKDGVATVEIISQDGKLLKTLQTGNLQKGVHQLKVDVREIPASTFFYRVSDAQGTSLVKSIKAD
jgi:hypothetical protein